MKDAVMGETEDVIMNLLRESESEQRRKAFIHELAQAVAREIPRECPLGLTEEELRGLRDLSGFVRKGRGAFGRLLWMLLIASLVGGLAIFLEKCGLRDLLK
jgi:hypothetical protein